MYGGLNKPGAMFVGHVNVTLPNSEGKSKEHSMPKNRLTAEAREEKERVMCHLREYIRSEAGAALEARALAFILNNFRTKGGGEWVSQTRKQYVNYDCPKLIRVSVKTVYDTIVVPDRQWWQKNPEASPVCSWLYNSVEEEVGLVENDDEDEFGDMFGTSIDSISLNTSSGINTDF